VTGMQAFVLGAVGLGIALSLGGPRGRRWATGYMRWSLLALAAGLTLTPFAWLFCAAFKTPSALLQHPFLPPLSAWSTDLTLANFTALFTAQPGYPPFWRYLLNSLFLSSAATVIQVVLCSAAGWALAKYRFKGRGVLLAFMLGSMAIPSMVLLAPLYSLTFHLGWLDTWWPLLIPGAVSAFGVFLFRQAALAVPDELLEAARIDGASELRIWLQVGMPLVRPMTGAFCLITFLGQWNSFLGPQVFVTRQELLTLPVALNNYMGVYSQQYGVFLAGTMLAIIPPAILFFALQREFVSGLTSGAVKG